MGHVRRMWRTSLCTWTCITRRTCHCIYMQMYRVESWKFLNETSPHQQEQKQLLRHCGQEDEDRECMEFASWVGVSFKGMEAVWKERKGVSSEEKRLPAPREGSHQAGCESPAGVAAPAPPAQHRGAPAPAFSPLRRGHGRPLRLLRGPGGAPGAGASRLWDGLKPRGRGLSSSRRAPGATAAWRRGQVGVPALPRRPGGADLSPRPR